MKLNILTVGYNEETNLPKLFESLKYIKSKIDIRHIYIDQTSTDNSFGIAKKFGAEVYVHENKGYADPDKKWAVESLLTEDDWCLILDGDEELSKELSDEIVGLISTNTDSIYKIKLKVYLLGPSFVVFNQLRLFKKSAIIITDEVHNYLKAKNNYQKTSENFIINKDNKDLNKSIFNHINKINTYSEKELYKYPGLSKSKIVIFMALKPFLSFVQWYIFNGLIKHGLSGFIVSLNMSYYTFTIYTKLYEKNITTVY